MTRSAVSVIASFGAMLALLAGCASQEEGNAAPETSGRASHTPPGRPAKLDLTGIDPCSLLTKRQRADLDIGRVVDEGSDRSLKAPSCSFREQKVVSLDVVADSRHSINMWQGKPVPKESTTVAGFPALLLKPDESICVVLTDVHEGQQLKVRNLTLKGKGSKDVCSSVKQWTKAALQTLRTLQ